MKRLGKKKKMSRKKRKFQRENQRRQLKGLKLLQKGETPAEVDTTKNDPILNESAHILTDLIKLEIG